MKNVTILLAEDHKIVREGIKRLLELEPDFNVIGEAADGFEAARLVAELQPDILLTDLKMPGMDGIEVTRQAKKASPKTDVIILSMYDSNGYVFAALEAGAKGYVLKQSSPGDLVCAIRVVANGEKYLSPPLSEAAIGAYRQRRQPPVQ